jgi:hypothetical protein
LYWRQKFRLAASWENDGNGWAGNIVKQAVEMPVVVCSVGLYNVVFMFSFGLLFNYIWAWQYGNGNCLLFRGVAVTVG